METMRWSVPATFLAAGGLVAVASCISIPDLVSGRDDAGADATSDTASDAVAPPDGGADATTEAMAPADADAGRSCPGTYRDAVLALPGLIAYWRLDETDGGVARDLHGGNDGIYRSGVALGHPGLLVGDPDPAIALDGDAGSFVQVPYHPALDLSTFTLAALVQPAATDGPRQVLAHTLAYWLQLDPPQNTGSPPELELGLIDDAGLDHPEHLPSGDLAVGKIALVAGTYDGNAVHLYVDGAPIGVVPLHVGVAQTTNDLFIGSWDGTSNLQAGVVDEAFVASGALTDAQIAGLWAAARGCAYDAGG